jgi:hypothetical protein
MDSEIARGDQSVVRAAERVVDAGQTLILRRIDLLVEELRAHHWSLFTFAIAALAGVATAVAGYFVALGGIVDWLDDYYARSGVEIAVGALHVAVGAAVLWRGRRWTEQARS